ncbi:ABC transporter ATP-binding protein [Brevundimonas bullata]|uniref:ABC transporter ATP-binding protein n=1 Tax=Brevundimonas bullata TaxID=13160 RepID=UPI0014730C8B|nr:ABC transporter ATP-binding protein [Brevundimonas bullata]WQE38193.1 ABC transporter ATP-binding protein [Brevundimonas bullata]
MSALLELDGVVARIGAATVLDGVSLSVGSGELVALCGPNGAGKSSAIRAGLGLTALHSGVAKLGNEDVRRLSERERGTRAAYLPQERHTAWNLPAIEVAALGAPFLSGAEALERASAALDEVGAAHLAERGVAEMSGGERARVLLARALVVQAPLLLADEPIAGLDPDAQLLVLERLRARADAGGGVLVSLHDLTLAARVADRVVVLDAGRVVADAAPVEALSPGVLRSVFGLGGVWVEGPDGPLLAGRRLSGGG